MAYIPHTVRKPLSRISDKLSVVWRAVRNEVFQPLIFADALLMTYFIMLATESILVSCVKVVVGQRLREVPLVYEI